MSRFAEHAQQLLDAATGAVARGENCSEMTVLITSDGGIQLCVDSDWPLDTLALDRGARAAYRVTSQRGSVRVEGQEGSRRCVLETQTPRKAARFLLPGSHAPRRQAPQPAGF